jgi:type IV pilus assembly protein PilE
MMCTDAFLKMRTGPRAGRGFSLLELMITVVVISILSAVAIPSYQQYNKRANRSAAAQLMLNIAQREEQYLLDARAYTAALNSTGLNITQDGWACAAASCVNTFYTVSVAAAGGTPPSYTVTAVPMANYQASDGTLTLTSVGARSRSAGDGKW